MSGAKLKSEADQPEDVGDVCKKRRRDLSSDLRGMINRSESSDVVLECNDGIRIYAIRLILSSRCNVFKSMLSNGMLETNQSVVLLPKFSSPVMLSIIEYLYTGAIESYYLSHWKMAFELVSAAQFFIIPEVEECARKFLWTQFDRNTKKSSLMEMLSVAVEFAETWEGKDKMLRDFVIYIGSDWLDEDCCRKLSRKAVEYILSNSERNRIIGHGEVSVEEYFTFRKIVLWHVYQTMPVCEAKVALQSILPGEEPSLRQRVLNISVDIDSFLLDTSTSADALDSSATLNRLLGIDGCKDSLVQLLTHVNLNLIPAPLLLKVLHPLKMFPSQRLLKALVHIAVDRRSLAKFDWEHGPSLKIRCDGEIMCSSADGKARGVGVAIIPSPSGWSSDVQEWTFRILEDDAQYIELGFIHAPSPLDSGQLQKLKWNLWHWPPARVLCVNRDKRKTYLSRDSLTKFWGGWECFDSQVEVNTVVNFQMNVLEKTCRVTFGDSFKAEWTELPDGEYHPAVGFLLCKRARVELKLRSELGSF